MGKILIFIFVIFSLCSYSQEDSLRTHVNREILAGNKIESYIEVNDSIDLFINAMQKRFGEVEEVDGFYNWSGIELDSIGKDAKIRMIHGIWITKKTQIEFKPISPEKISKLKDNEKRGIRIRVFQKDGKDALLRKPYEIVMTKLFEDLLNSEPEKTEE